MHRQGVTCWKSIVLCEIYGSLCLGNHRIEHYRDFSIETEGYKTVAGYLNGWHLYTSRRTHLALQTTWPPNQEENTIKHFNMFRSTRQARGVKIHLLI